MTPPWRRIAARAQYGAGQAARIAWFTGHYLAGRALLRDDAAAALNPAERARIRETFGALFADDLASIENGDYKMPAVLRRPPSLAAAAAASLDYLSDARAVGARRKRHGHSEVATAAARARYPRYYLQNFHYQSDGWLSAKSAARYDMQVETLFTGAGDAMRRRALPAIRRALTGRDPATATLVDFGCGDGGFLAAVKDNWPTLRVTGVDLSAAYLAHARVALSGLAGVALREAAVERTGLGDAAFDVATSVFLFHELPPAIRRDTAAEIARVLKPGGVYVHADTLQYGDDPALDGVLAAFPGAVHEPYYDSYCRDDLCALFGDAGLAREGDARAFLTKISVFRKPA